MSEKNQNIQQDEDGREIVFMKCRRSDQQGGSCGNDVAYIHPVNNSTIRYECKKCGGTWTINTGGTFQI